MTQADATVEVKRIENPEQMRKRIFDELKREFADWLTAKEDLVWRPSIELSSEQCNEFAVRLLVPGVDASDLELLVAPDVLLIKGETRARRKIFRSVEFPRPVNPAEVHAEIKDGMLSIKAEIAEPKKLNVEMHRAA